MPKPEQLHLEGVSEQPKPEADAGHIAVRAALQKRGSKREAYRRQRVAVGDDVEFAPLAPKKTLAERMLVLHNEHGFYPVSRTEATQAFSLLHHLGTPFSTIKYLNEAYMRQSKEGVAIDDPRRTPLHMVLDFANHRDDANLTGVLLRSLHARLEDVLNPQLTMGVLEDEIPLDYVIPLYRQHELANFARNIDNDYSNAAGTVIDRNVMVEPVVDEFEASLIHFADTMTVKQAKDATNILLIEQQAREAFWNDRVSEADRHLPSRPAVDRLSR